MRSAQSALRKAGASVEAIAVNDDRVFPAAVLEHLAQRDINEVLLECGPTLAGAFMAAGLVDELVLYLAPHLMGDSGRGLFSLPGLEKMRDRIELEWLDVRSVGNDWRITARPKS